MKRSDIRLVIIVLSIAGLVVVLPFVGFFLIHCGGEDIAPRHFNGVISGKFEHQERGECIVVAGNGKFDTIRVWDTRMFPIYKESLIGDSLIKFEGARSILPKRKDTVREYEYPVFKYD